MILRLPPVQHDAKNLLFYLLFNEPTKCRAFLQYRIIGEKKWDFWHTEVPLSLSGKGVASHLAKGAMAHVVAHDYRVRMSCSYLRDHFLPRHFEEYKKYVDVD